MNGEVRLGQRYIVGPNQAAVVSALKQIPEESVYKNVPVVKFQEDGNVT